MKKILGLIFNRWVLGAVLLLALAMLIWLIGPLVAIALEKYVAARGQVNPAIDGRITIAR